MAGAHEIFEPLSLEKSKYLRRLTKFCLKIVVLACLHQVTERQIWIIGVKESGQGKYLLNVAIDYW